MTCYEWFSSYVISAMQVEGKQIIDLFGFVYLKAFVHFINVICVSIDGLKTTFTYTSLISGLSPLFCHFHMQIMANLITLSVVCKICMLDWRWYCAY